MPYERTTWRDLANTQTSRRDADWSDRDGRASKGAMLTIQQAQLAMNDVPAFKGNVKTIRTDVLVDRAAEDLYPTWEKNRDQWNLTGGDHPYHYLGSAIWFTRLGRAMAEAMMELLQRSSLP